MWGPLPHAVSMQYTVYCIDLQKEAEVSANAEWNVGEFLM